jgi:magnesium transporter
VEHLISWKYIHPLTINPVSMTIKVDIPQKNLSSIPAADLGEIFLDLNMQHQIALFKSLDISSKVKIFSNINFKRQRSLLEELDEKQVTELLGAMPSDEATDFLERLPKDRTKNFLALMESKQAKKLSELMGYSSDSAGGLMTKDFMAFTKGTPIESVLKAIKERPGKVEPVQFVYIIDEQGRFFGSANYRHLIMSAPQDLIEKAAFPKTYYVHLDSSVKEVAYLMEKYKYSAIAVVDKHNVLQGIITVDDILSQLIAIAWRRFKRIKALPLQASHSATQQTTQQAQQPQSAQPQSQPPQPPQEQKG